MVGLLYEMFKTVETFPKRLYNAPNRDSGSISVADGAAVTPTTPRGVAQGHACSLARRPTACDIRTVHCYRARQT